MTHDESASGSAAGSAFAATPGDEAVSAVLGRLSATIQELKQRGIEVAPVDVVELDRLISQERFTRNPPPVFMEPLPPQDDVAREMLSLFKKHLGRGDEWKGDE